VHGLFAILTILIYKVDGKSTTSIEPKIENTTHNCPFTRIIEDIFNINNKTSQASLKNNQSGYFLNTTDSLINTDSNISKTIQDELVNDIIASIKRIKANLTQTNSKLDEAIILNVPDNEKNEKPKITTDKKENTIKSGIEDRKDVLKTTTPKNNINYKIDDANEFNIPNKPDFEQKKNQPKDETNFVEILTVEPNNTNINKSSHSILEVLKNIMPMLNASVTKDLHSITIIERNQNKNHSFSETKNISTIIVKYCDKENLTTVNVTDTKPPDEDVKGISVQEEYDDYNMDDDIDYDDSNPDKMTNITIESRKDVLEAAEYGMRKMHELYGVLEPKLYSMGLILDDKDPARYVAAFNAPSEDIAQYAKYGYASLQAASRFKELISQWSSREKLRPTS
ncbi:jg16848, partial [Pararge aegeria aegeria]